MRSDHIRVPPDDPAYTLRRVWLSEEEQEGYYYGLANEGLWPLCHIAFVRPTFRQEDWQQYVAINQRFADAVVEEATREDPIVLIHDYHFALLPRMIRERLPERHHPDVLAHSLAQRGDVRHLPLARGDHRRAAGQHDPGLSHAVPLQQFPRGDRPLRGEPDRSRAGLRHVRRPRDHDPALSDLDRVAAGCARRSRPRARNAADAVRRRFALPAEARIAVGIERFDYTKGILDRMRAIDDLLTRQPEWKGRLRIHPGRRAHSQQARCLQRAAGERRSDWRRRNQRPARSRLLQADRAGRPPSRARRGLRAVPGRRRVHRLQPARRHEPGCQGVRRLARRRAGRADPVEPSPAPRASLSEALIVNPYDTRGMAEAHRARAARCPGRAARAHAADARPRSRAQRLPLGGPDAARCGEVEKPAADCSGYERATIGVTSANCVAYEPPALVVWCNAWSAIGTSRRALVESCPPTFHSGLKCFDVNDPDLTSMTRGGCGAAIAAASRSVV